jgi:hypothetical protein
MKNLKFIVIFILFFSLLSVSFTKAQTINNNFKVTILNEKHDLTYHEVLFEVQNLDPNNNRDFYVGSLFQNTSFDLSKVGDVYIYEYKPVNQSFDNYTTIYQIVYYPYPENITNFTLPSNCFDCNSTHYGCNETTTVNNPYYAMKLDWKPSKMALLTQPDKVVASYGYITIPQLGSKRKYDDFNQPYDYNGTKIFKITWKTPITKTPYGFGSYGYYAIYDPANNISYDPWWNSAWQYRRNITINNTQNANTLTDYQVAINLTYDTDMQPDFSDIRFTNLSDIEIPYWIESKSNSNWAYVWVKVPQIPASSTATIYVYYGNTTPVSSQSNGTATFPQFDDFSTNTISTYTMLRQSNSGTFALNWNSTDYTAYDTVTSIFGDVNWVKASFEAGYSIRGSVRNASTTTRGGFAFIVENGNYNTLAGIALYSDYPACGICGFYFNDGSGVEPAKKLKDVTNGFHTLEIANPNATVWLIRADNETWFDFTFSMSGTLYPSLRDRPQSTSAKSVWDWWLVRKFADPEPTYSIGSEETPLPPSPPQKGIPMFNAMFGLVMAGGSLLFVFRALLTEGSGEDKIKILVAGAIIFALAVAVIASMLI